MLEIKNLNASIQEKNILNGLNLKIGEGEIHAIMGTNGSGKSTFSKILAGHPSYKISEGEIFFEKKNITEETPEKRSHMGIFIGFQYPVEIPGLTNEEFLRTTYNAKRKYENLSPVNPIEFFDLIKPKLEITGLNYDFLSRNVNEGFSGGEKKKNEILQMHILNPKLSVLDEIDSGLDIDALKNISTGIRDFIKNKKSLILITHYNRLLDYIKPNFVHIMYKGKIIKSGDSSLALDIENQGYNWLNPD